MNASFQPAPLLDAFVATSIAKSGHIFVPQVVMLLSLGAIDIFQIQIR